MLIVRAQIVKGADSFLLSQVLNVKGSSLRLEALESHRIMAQIEDLRHILAGVADLEAFDNIHSTLIGSLVRRAQPR